MNEQKIYFSKRLTKSEFEKTYHKFLKLNGCLTKCMNKSENLVMGYLARCEIPNYPNFVSISYESVIDKNGNIRPLNFVKTIAMNKAIMAGIRKLKKFETNNSLENFKSESSENVFKKPEELSKEIKNYFEKQKNNEDNNSNKNSYEIFNKLYTDFYEYVKLFESKVNKYYKNKNVKIVWINFN